MPAMRMNPAAKGLWNSWLIPESRNMIPMSHPRTTPTVMVLGVSDCGMWQGEGGNRPDYATDLTWGEN